MHSKIPFYILAVILLATACAPVATPIATSIPPTGTAVNTVIPVQPTTAATEAASVPKQKDLLFVEFFAVT
jgi:hypothetical protein